MIPKKYYYFLAIFIAFFGLFFVVKTASAGGIPFISELPSSEGFLSSIEEIAGPILQEAIGLFTAIIKAFVMVFVSAHLLDWAMTQPIGLDDKLVTTGWAFTLALTNLIFIFIILYIAIKQIVSDEGDMNSIKKYLPRLITTILLVNFGVVFIKMAIDIAFILQRSMVPSDSSLAFNSLSGLEQQISGILISYGLYFGAGILASFLPSAAAVWQGLAWPTYILMAPARISAEIQIYVCNTLAGIYFLYALYFIIRIYVIKILTIIFPLAFACYAIPSEGAQKLWKQWSNFFITWVFFPIPLLFFLVLGLKLLQDIMPAGMAAMATPLAFWQIATNGNLLSPAVNYYIALIAYLATLAYLKVKFSPSLDIGGIKGGALIDKGKNFVLNRAKQSFAGAAVNQRAREKTVQAEEASGKKSGWMKRTGMMAGSLAAGVVENEFRSSGTTSNIELAKAIKEKKEEYKKQFGEDMESASKFFNDPSSAPKTDLEKRAFSSYLVDNAKSGEDLKKALDGGGFLKRSFKIENLKERKARVTMKVEDLLKASDEKTADALKRSMIGETVVESKLWNLTGGSKDIKSKFTLAEEEVKKVVGGAKSEEDMKQFIPGFEKDPAALEKIMEFDVEQLTALAKTHRSALKEYVKKVNEKGVEDFAKDHASQMMFIVGTAGQAVLRDKDNNVLDKKAIQEMISGVKKHQEDPPIAGFAPEKKEASPEPPKTTEEKVEGTGGRKSTAERINEKRNKG
ncbi:MAG: hypothetical protein WCX77_00850 [Candidatus Paceibacterota bacterium]|jgi:hypothetical protein